MRAVRRLPLLLVFPAVECQPSLDLRPDATNVELGAIRLERLSEQFFDSRAPCYPAAGRRQKHRVIRVESDEPFQVLRAPGAGPFGAHRRHALSARGPRTTRGTPLRRAILRAVG